jgi:Mn-dependent DtxR family transcriptional regulator
MRTLYELAEPHFPQRRPVHVNELLARRSWTERSLQRLIDNADDDGLLVRDAKGGCLLTDDGLVHAAEVVRCQRIWDRFLDEYADQAATVGDPNTDSPDDFLPPRVLAELEAKLRGENRLPDFEAFCGAKEAR